LSKEEQKFCEVSREIRGDSLGEEKREGRHRALKPRGRAQIKMLRLLGTRMPKGAEKDQENRK
jgi:hypothetical protein